MQRLLAFSDQTQYNELFSSLSMKMTLISYLACSNICRPLPDWVVQSLHRSSHTQVHHLCRNNGYLQLHSLVFGRELQNKGDPRSSGRSPAREGAAAAAAPPRPPPPAASRPASSSARAAPGLRGAAPRPRSSASWRRRPRRYDALIPRGPGGRREGRDPAAARAAAAADASPRTPPDRKSVV